MKHPKSLKVVFAALAVSMVPLFGSCDSGADSAAKELEDIKRDFGIFTVEYQFPSELPESFELELYWVWKQYDESDYPLINSDRLPLDSRYDAEQIAIERRAYAGYLLGIGKHPIRNNALAGTSLKIHFQQNEGSSWRWAYRLAEEVGGLAGASGVIHQPYPAERYAGGSPSSCLQFRPEWTEEDQYGGSVHCCLEFVVVEVDYSTK